MQLDAALREVVPGARVSSLAPDLAAYARDLWPRRLIELQAREPIAERPAAVVWPESVEHVSALVGFARRQGIALVPFGAGSGVCGAIEAVRGSIVVDVKRFASFSIGHGPELDSGAGVLGITLEEALLEAGYTTGHYPSSILCSTVGGWAAARGAGQCSGRYGKIEDMVTFVEAVLGSGEVLRAQRRAQGPDLVPLLIGSEGTLGIITRVGLRLHPAPAARAFSAFAFDSMQEGMQALRLLYQSGLRPSVARLYDPLDTLLLKDGTDVEKEPAPSPRRDPGLRAAALRTVLRIPSVIASALAAAEHSLLARSALVLVHEGDAASVAHESRQASALCVAARGTSLGEGPARAWYRHRYSVSYRQAPVFRSGAFSDTLEVAAPWSRLEGVYEGVRRALGEHVLVMAHLSHAYPDGASIYFTFAGIEHGGESSLAVYDRAVSVALRATLDAGATLSHHHGVGRSKAPRVGEELGAAVAVVRALKTAWDPDGILNPGALIPPLTAAERIQEPLADRGPALDQPSCLTRLPGSLSLAAAQAWLAPRGHTLSLTPAVLAELASVSVSDWIGMGLPGLPDRYEDPVFSPLAGFEAELRSGFRFQLRPTPRRAVGPDLSALVRGMGGALGRVHSATLVAVPSDAPPAPVLPYSGERNPSIDPSEKAALVRLTHELASL